LSIDLKPEYPVVDLEHVGPPIGSRFPDVRLPNQHGRLVDLHMERAGRRAIVVIYRSASW
jgi:hypothetical protein